MIYRATLKKPWRSHRGKIYPKGTTFSFVKNFPEIKTSLYDFKVPGKCYGIMVIPDRVFRQLSPEEKELKALRKKALEDHIKNYKDKFIKIIF